jgi:hypothetical protein
MAHPARILTAVLLTAALAVPATLHASGLPDLRLTVRNDGASSTRAVGLWSFDWLSHLLRQARPECGPGLDPHGGCGNGTPPQNPSEGGGLDPNGKPSLGPVAPRPVPHPQAPN